MMPINYSAAIQTADEQVKQAAATKQMRELMDRLADGKTYRTLTRADRKILINEGYAPDLVDNLVYLTLRTKVPGLGDVKFQDKLCTGFTYAAFDPAIYSSASIRNHFRGLSQNCCAYCESFLSATGSEILSHFRPPSIVREDEQTLRSPYFLLAYDQTNLVYSCPQCSDTYKNDSFPVSGQRTLNTELNSENALLINPYQENPRDFIRFNTTDGSAYAYDALSQYLNETQKLPDTDIQNYLWSHPNQIPAISNNDNTKNNFQDWINQNPQKKFKGLTTINLLQLNRTSLLKMRQYHLIQLIAFFSQTRPDSDAINLDFSLQYRSLTIDAFNTWKKTLVSLGDDDKPLFNNEKVTEAINQYVKLSQAKGSDPGPTVPTWMASSLIYMVLENELTVSGKRRIVNLSSSDYLYGEDNPEKCVFINIDWEADIQNIIKVRSKKNIWETTFTELAASRPLEISKLFSQNEVWAEGQYPALVGQ